MKPRLSMVLVLAACAGCSVGPDFRRPEVAPEVGYARESPLYGREVIDQWWTLFDSPEIDAIVRRGLAANPNLAAAQAALAASEHALKAGQGVFYPQVGVGVSALRERISRFDTGLVGPGAVFNLLTLGGAITYAIDVFGSNRRVVEKLSAEVDYQRALREGTYLTLTANLVNTSIAQSAYLAQVETTERLIALQKRQAALLETQWRAGTVALASVAAARQQLTLDEAAAPVLRRQMAAAANLLASLSGRTPAEWVEQPVTFEALNLPPQLPVSLPSDLVRQRPDILAAEASLHAASAQIGVATAALFPTLTLGASAGYAAPNASLLGTPASRTGSIGPSINIPVFSGFSGVEARGEAQAQYQQALAAYRQTVVNAFGEVGNALEALRQDGETEADQRRVYEIAEQQRRFAAANRSAGLISELQEIASRVQLEQAHLGWIQARAVRLQDGTALLVALGRPWRQGNVEGRR